MTEKEKLKKLKKLADAMYYAAQYLTTDASRLHKAMDEYHQFIIHKCKEEPVSEQNLSNVERIGKNWKEPVSEDLEEAANFYADTHTEWFDADNNPHVSPAFKAGANWQKEQMMKDATEVIVHIEAGNYPYIPQIELYDYDKDIPLAKEGDKVKIIIVKED